MPAPAQFKIVYCSYSKGDIIALDVSSPMGTCAQMPEDASEHIHLMRAAADRLINLCVDTEKPVLLDPLRQALCLRSIERERTRNMLNFGLSEIKSSVKLPQVVISRLLAFLNTLVSPGLTLISTERHEALTCVAKRDFSADNRTFTAPSVLSLPFERALPFMFAGYLDCIHLIP